MPPLTGSEGNTPRNDAWAALIARVIELAPNADAEQLKLLTSAYRDLA